MDKFLIKKRKLVPTEEPTNVQKKVTAVQKPASAAIIVETASQDYETPTAETVVDKLSRNKVSSNYRKFNTNWTNKFKWLHYEREIDKAYCSVCKEAEDKKLLIFSSKKECAFLKTGFSNWKKGLEKFAAHEKSHCHRESNLKLSTTHVNVSSQLLTSHRSEMTDAREALQKIFTTIQFLTRQGLAVRGSDEANSNFYQCLIMRMEESEELKKWMNRTSKYKWLSPKTQNEIIGVMAKEVLRNVISRVKSAGMFSLIADETSDLSRKEQVSFCIRSVTDQFEICEDFIGLYETTATDATSLFQILKDVLCRLNLPFEHLRGQCYDGASNMSGKFSGLQTKVREVQPKAIYVHCAAHSLNLGVQDVLKNVPIVRDSMNLVKELINTIRQSPKRLHWFKSFQSDGQHSLRPLCPTRWIMRVSSVQTVLENYSSLMDFLEDFSVEDTSEAAARCSGFLLQLHLFTTYFTLKLIELALGPVEELNMAVQSPEWSLTGMNSQFEYLLLLITEKRSEDQFNEFWVECTTNGPKNGVDEPTLPRLRRVPRRLENDNFTEQHVFLSPKDYYRKVYYDVLDCVYASVQERYLSNSGFQTARQLEIELLSAAQGDKCDLKTIDSQFQGDVDQKRLTLHLAMFADIVKSKNLKIETTHDIVKLLKKDQQLRDLLPELSNVLKLFLVIPVTSCTAERSFSTLRRIKTYLRTTMRQDRLNHLALLNCHKELVGSLNLHTLINEFINSNDIRKANFAQYV